MDGEVKNVVSEVKETSDVSEKRFRTFKYIAAVVAWGIALIGVVVDYIKDNPLPKKTSDEFNR